MEAIIDFLRAALPWIAIGLLLAVFAARSAGRKKKEKESDNYGTEGMCMGMCLGWLFAFLTAARFVLAVMNYIISKKII